jgi:hypothetical protein
MTFSLSLLTLSYLWAVTLASYPFYPVWLSGTHYINQEEDFGALGVPSSTNMPPARSGGLGWLGLTGLELMLFSGTRCDTFSSNCLMNDVWRFDIITELWTWVKGSSDYDQGGVYGSKGIENEANTPSSRA